MIDHLNESAAPPSPIQILESGNKKLEAASDIEVYESFLDHCPLLEDGLNYLTRRAISEETIDNFRIGQIDDNEEVAISMMERFRRERLESAGLLSRKPDSNSTRLIFPDQSIVFPFLKNGKAISLQARQFAKE